MSFLTAEWRKLAIANYSIDSDYLKNYIPFGTELDIWDDKCYVSLVGFMFMNTKLLGIPIPFHTNFEEVNLRFYVKRKEGNTIKRGVVFIREFVPLLAPAILANLTYKEHYEAIPMEHKWINSTPLTVEYNWKKLGKKHTFTLNADPAQKPLVEDSETEFITEHYWGYTKVDANKTFEYQVTHPRWNVYDVLNYSIDVDFDLLYGKEFAFLNALSPDSVMLAEGSAITVEKKKIIT